jgi:xanthine dehydrogenase accessory factor
VRPTSARPGARGLIHPDGSIEGWVGGSCAQPVVVKEALRALADGQPRLLRISRDGGSGSRRGDGIVELVMTCHSGGTLEIYVEPVLPAAALWVVGITPIAAALVELGTSAGYAVTLVDPIASGEDFPAAGRVVGDADLAGLDPGTAPFAVVATQGQWDEEAVAALLRRDVAYLGLVASPRRAQAVREFLETEGVPAERIAAVRAPAGIDLGAETPGEVAVSILAELVQVRRGRAPFVASPGPATLAGHVGAATSPSVDAGHGTAGLATEPADMAEVVLLDPVCGMTVERDQVRHLAEHGGAVYAFCCLACRTRFVRDPDSFLPAGAGSGA